MITCQSSSPDRWHGVWGAGLGIKANKAIRNVWARYVFQDLRDRDMNADAALREAGLTTLALADDEGWIPFTKHSTLLDCAADQTSDDCYRARMATKVDIRDSGAVAYIGFASKTLEDALRNLERYSRVLSEAVQIRLSLGDRTATLEGVADHELQVRCGHAMEFGVSLLLSYYRFCTHRRITPLEVRFVHRRKTGVTELGQILGCPVRFGCARLEETLKREDLAIPLPSFDDKLLTLLKKHAEMVLSARGTNQPDLLQQLERRIVELLPKGQARAKILASEIGISERSFHRRLGEMGTSFTNLVDRLRYELAMRYVEDRHVSLSDVAFLLGYANQSSFSTAFRRWTGTAPRQVRISAH
jgi:AraC-like DNA-binding protein